MKANKHIAAWLFLNILTLGTIHSPVGAAQAKAEPSQRGGQSNKHMNAKGLTNTNAQWSADPERGWVRADERHAESHGKAKANQIRGRQKSNSGKGIKD